MTPETAAPSPAPPREPATLSTWQLLQQLAGELPRLVGDRVDLLALELHRAALALTQVVVLIIGAAILGVTAWLAAWGLVAYVLVTLGLATWLAWLIVLLLNAGAAAFAFLAARKLLVVLTLPATRRHLRQPFAAFKRDATPTSTTPTPPAPPPAPAREQPVPGT